MQLLDQEGTEWDDGGTKECKLRAIDTDAATLAIVDAPGRQEYQRAVVSGLSGADAMVLVIDASESVAPAHNAERIQFHKTLCHCIHSPFWKAQPVISRIVLADKFEEGMSKGGQTRTHALLAYAFGVRSVVVAITQLDNLVPPYTRKRYESCQSEVLRYLKRVGFVQDRVACVPVSGLCGDNICEISTNLSWCGSTGLQHIPCLSNFLQRVQCALQNPSSRTL